MLAFGEKNTREMVSRFREGDSKGISLGFFLQGADLGKHFLLRKMQLGFGP